MAEVDVYLARSMIGLSELEGLGAFTNYYLLS